MNKVLLSGRLVADPQLMQTSNGKSYCFFSLACSKFVKGEQGADFVNCIAWEKTAENLCRYMKKGGRLNIVGKLETRKSKEGNYILEVVTETMEFIDTKQEKSPTPDDFNGEFDPPY